VIPKCPRERGRYKDVPILSSHTDSLAPDGLSSLDGLSFMRWIHIRSSEHGPHKKKKAQRKSPWAFKK